MKIDKEKLKNIDKLPADVRRELALLMNKHDQFRVAQLRIGSTWVPQLNMLFHGMINRKK